MAALSEKAMIALAYAGGFRGGQIDKIVAIAHQESGYNPAATHVNSDGSRDRGLYQINDRFHPTVTDTCAYDPVCSTHAAYTISNSGKDFGAWDGNVDGWPSQVAGVKKSRTAGGWKNLVGQYSAGASSARGGRGPRGQPDNTNPGGGPGTADNGQTTAQAIQNAQAAKTTSTKLFDCNGASSGGVNVAGVQVVPNFLPGAGTVGCYLLSTLEFVGLAIGGVALIGIGVYMMATGKSVGQAAKSVAKGGAGAVVGAVAPEADAAELAGKKAFQVEAGRQAARRAAQTPEDVAAQRARTRRTNAQARRDNARAAETRANLPQTSRGKLYSMADEARIDRAMKSGGGKGRPDRMAG